MSDIKEQYEIWFECNKELPLTTVYADSFSKDVAYHGYKAGYEAQQAEIQRLQSIIKDMQQVDDVLAPQNEIDAKRYRWLKAQNAELEQDSFVVLGHDCKVEDVWQKYWVGSDLDKAIDDAMSK